MKYAKRFTAFALLLFMLFSQCVFAGALDYDTADGFLKNSVILCAKKPYYYANGIKNYFDLSNKNYAPQYDDGEIYVSVTQFKKLFGTEYTYGKADNLLTLKNGGNTAVVKIGEDLANVNGKNVRYTHPAVFNGVRTLLPIGETARLLGFYVYGFEKCERTREMRM